MVLAEIAFAGPSGFAAGTPTGATWPLAGVAWAAGAETVTDRIFPVAPTMPTTSAAAIAIPTAPNTAPSVVTARTSAF